MGELELALEEHEEGGAAGGRRNPMVGHPRQASGLTTDAAPWRGQTSRARPPPTPTPGDITNPSGRPSNRTHMPLPILVKGASQAGQAQDLSLKLPVRAEGRL